MDQIEAAGQGCELAQQAKRHRHRRHFEVASKAMQRIGPLYADARQTPIGAEGHHLALHSMLMRLRGKRAHHLFGATHGLRQAGLVDLQHP